MPSPAPSIGTQVPSHRPTTPSVTMPSPAPSIGTQVPFRHPTTPTPVPSSITIPIPRNSPTPTVSSTSSSLEPTTLSYSYSPTHISSLRAPSSSQSPTTSTSTSSSSTSSSSLSPSFSNIGNHLIPTLAPNNINNNNNKFLPTTRPNNGNIKRNSTTVIAISSSSTSTDISTYTTPLTISLCIGAVALGFCLLAFCLLPKKYRPREFCCCCCCSLSCCSCLSLQCLYRSFQRQLHRQQSFIRYRDSNSEFIGSSISSYTATNNNNTNTSRAAATSTSAGGVGIGVDGSAAMSAAWYARRQQGLDQSQGQGQGQSVGSTHHPNHNPTIDISAAGNRKRRGRGFQKPKMEKLKPIPPLIPEICSQHLPFIINEDDEDNVGENFIYQTNPFFDDKNKNIINDKNNKNSGNDNNDCNYSNYRPSFLSAGHEIQTRASALVEPARISYPRSNGSIRGSGSGSSSGMPILLSQRQLQGKLQGQGQVQASFMIPMYKPDILNTTDNTIISDDMSNSLDVSFISDISIASVSDEDSVHKVSQTIESSMSHAEDESHIMKLGSIIIENNDELMEEIDLEDSAHSSSYNAHSHSEQTATELTRTEHVSVFTPPSTSTATVGTPNNNSNSNPIVPSNDIINILPIESENINTLVFRHPSASHIAIPQSSSLFSFPSTATTTTTTTAFFGSHHHHHHHQHPPRSNSMTVSNEINGEQLVHNKSTKNSGKNSDISAVATATATVDVPAVAAATVAAPRVKPPPPPPRCRPSSEGIHPMNNSEESRHISSS
eukprot:gene8509-17546_t